MVEERPRDAHSELRGTLRVGPSTSERSRATFVFADRSGEKGNFSDSLAWKARDPDGLEVPRPKAAVGDHPRVLLPITCSKTRMGSLQQTHTGRR